VNVLPSLRGTFARMTLLSWELRGTFNCGAQNLGLGLKAGGRLYPLLLLLLVGLVFPQLLFPLIDFPKTEVANVVVVGGGGRIEGAGSTTVVLMMR